MEKLQRKLNKLNDGSFQRGQAKVKNQVEDIADDLMKALFWA